MSLSVHSEVAPLRRVLLHRPGPEIVRMTQLELETLLFDDILQPDLAATEHDVLRDILQAEGAEALGLFQLLVRALERAPAVSVSELLGQVCVGAAVPELAPLISTWSAERQAAALVTGVLWEEIETAPLTLARLQQEVEGPALFAVPPVPNLMFQRDPCIAVYDKVLVGGMATEARQREPSLVLFALQHGLADPPELLFDARTHAGHARRRSLEGGDLLVLSPQTLMIGCSERTTPETIERITHQALFPAFPALERVFTVIMPARRSVMHLDTVLTQVDSELFLGHEPMMVRGEGVAVAELARGRRPRLLRGATVLDALREAISSAVRVVPCGGDDPIAQQREQWTDGANAVATRPGHIVLYSRNTHTIRHLVEQHGFEQVHLDARCGRDERMARVRAASRSDRVVFSFVGSELSRARGGGRCLTMPLLRG